MWNVKFVIDNFHLVLRFWVKNLSILVWFHMKSLKSRDSGMNKNSRYRIEVNLDSVKCYKFFQPWIFDELKLTDPSLRNTFKKVSCIAYKYYFPTFNWIDKSFRVWQYVDSHYMRRVRLENQKKKRIQGESHHLLLLFLLRKWVFLFVLLLWCCPTVSIEFARSLDKRKEKGFFVHSRHA